MNEKSVYSQNAEIEVNLSSLFWAVMSKWRRILAWALVFCVLLGGVRFWRTGYLQSPKADTPAAEEYEHRRALLDAKVETLQQELDHLVSFVTYSLTMNVNPDALYTISKTFFVDADYQILPENTLQPDNPTVPLVMGYCAGLRELNVAAVLGSREAPSEYDWDSYFLSVDTDNAKAGILAVSVSGGTQEQAEALAAAVEDTLTALQPKLEKEISEHKLVLLGNSRAVSRDKNLATLQTAQWTKVDELTGSLEKAVAERRAFENSSSQGHPGLRAVLKATVKYALVGAFLGFFLCAGYYFLVFLFGDRVLDDEAIAIRYKTDVLGVHGIGKKETGLDAAIARRRGIVPLSDQEKSLRRIAAALQYASKGSDRILLIGSVTKDRLEQLASQLGATGEITAGLTVCGDVNSDGGAIRAIGGGDTVFCVEELGVSRHKSIRSELGTLASMGKTCGGFLLLGKVGR